MFDVLKQSVFTSIGLASLAKERVGELVSEVARNAELTEQEAEDFRAEVDRRAEEARTQLSELIDKQIDHAMIQVALAKGEAVQAAGTAANALLQLIDDRVDAALEKLQVARTEEVDALLRRVELLEAKLNSSSD